MAYLTLKGELAKKSISISSVSTTLGIHRNSVANKIAGRGSFSIDEATLIRDAFFPGWDLTRLFSTEDDTQERGAM